jgi:(p)ppGpp synthase/HD superfamily hydrolase
MSTPSAEQPGGAPPVLTERFLAAVALAEQVHGHERRKGTEIPYIAHLLVVTGLVIEDGGDEDQAIAAMLHDAVEDGGGRAMLERIAHSFGARVAEIVEGCSDSVDLNPEETWIERKRRYLMHLPEVSDDAILRVALADKVHNARSIVRDYREEGTRYGSGSPKRPHAISSGTTAGCSRSSSAADRDR